MIRHQTSRWVRALAVAGLLLGVAAAPALAAPTAAAAVPAAAPTVAGSAVAGLSSETDPALINPATLGSLSIHKLLGAPGDETAYPADGTARPVPSTVKPLAGAVFTVTRVDGVDLTTNAGWQAAEAYSGNIAAAYASLGATITSDPTNPSGLAVVSGLRVGLYLVQEVGVRTAAGTQDPAYSRSADFLITIPTTDPATGTHWLYDLHVYPKNSRSGIVKSVADGNVGAPTQDASVAGRVLTYTLLTDIPSDGLRAFGGQCLRSGAVDTGIGLDANGFTTRGICADGASYDGTGAGAAYAIVDDLAAMVVPGSSPVRHTSDYLEFAAADWTGTVVVSLTAPTVTALTICPDGVDIDAAPTCDLILTRTATSVTVAMTDRGLAALAAAKAAVGTAKVQMTVEARVRSAVVGATQAPAGAAWTALAPVLHLPNRAMLLPHGTRPDPSGGELPGTSADLVPSNAVVTLYSSLRLHKVDAGTGAGLAGAVFTLYRTREDALAGRDPLAVSKATDSRGLTEFAGLHVTDYQNDAADDDSFWVVETTVPEGYAAVPGPVEVKLLQDGSTVGADASFGFPVPNPRSGPLPHTGSDTLPLVLLAAGLVAAGGLLMLAGRRRHQHHPDATRDDTMDDLGDD